MNEEAFNLSVRKFLKKLGITAQREIELGVRERLASGALRGNETLPARATVRVEGLVARETVQRQLVLGEREHGWSDADRAVDRATLRFGKAAVRPASLLG